MKTIIYLVGQISREKEITYTWRKEVREFFENNTAFGMIDPCDNEWNKAILYEKEKDPKRLKVYNKMGANLIVPKDYSYVLRSNGCIANMNNYDPKKPFVGTIFELAWYYQHPEKCVVGVYDGDWTKDAYCNHPFIRETVNVWCNDHIEAAELLKEYYQEG